MRTRDWFFVVFGVFLAGGVPGCSSRGLAPSEYEALLFKDRALSQPFLDEGKVALEQELKSKEQLTLEDCFQLALLYNDRLQLAGEDYLQAIVAKEKALAAVLPTVAVRATYSRQETAAAFGGLIAQNNEWLVFKQPIFSGLRDIHTLHQGDQNVLAKESNLHFEKGRILSLVADGFYENLKLRATLATLESLIQTQEERLRQMQERQKVGLARKTEVMLIETDLVDAKARQSRIQGDLEIAKARLAVLLGRPIHQPLVDEKNEVKSDSLESLIETAYIQRQDLRAQEHQMEIAKEQISVVLGEYLPTLSFLGNIYFHRDGIQKDVDWDILLSAEWPLFEGWATQARLKEAHSKLRQARTACEEQKKVIAQEVTRAFHTYRSLSQEIVALEKRAKLAEENYTLVQEEYKQGLATNLEIQLIYQQLINARLVFEEEVWNHKVAQVQVQFAIGQLK